MNNRRLWRWMPVVAVMTTLISVASSANAAGVVPGSYADAELNLVITGTPFGLAAGESRTVSVSGTRVGGGETGAGALNPVSGINGTCYLDGTLPYLIEPEGLVRRINFTASLRCDGVTGRVELTVGLQQGIPGGGYTNDKFNGPLANPTPLVILGVNSDPKPCFEISLGAWRGVAHPRLITDVIIYDFGWFPTYDVTLTC